MAVLSQRKGPSGGAEERARDWISFVVSVCPCECLAGLLFPVILLNRHGQQRDAKQAKAMKQLLLTPVAMLSKPFLRIQPKTTAQEGSPLTTKTLGQVRCLFQGDTWPRPDGGQS